MRPENGQSGLSAGKLWPSVPSHVQALLALERHEEEQEIAQYSYKRPFQEKRRELIERLLDPTLSLEDTARLLNVCPTTVRRYTNKGILSYYRKEPVRAVRGESEQSDTPAADRELTQDGSEGRYQSGNGGKETRQRRFRLSDILAFLETQQSAQAADRAKGNGRTAGAPRHNAVSRQHATGNLRAGGSETGAAPNATGRDSAVDQVED